MAPCYFTIILLCAALASHTPWSARTHHPPSAPVSPRLLLCGSLSHSLPLVLSCSLPCAPPSLSLLSVLVPLRPGGRQAGGGGGSPPLAKGLLGWGAWLRGWLLVLGLLRPRAGRGGTTSACRCTAHAGRGVVRARHACDRC